MTDRIDDMDEMRSRLRDVEKTSVLHGEKLHRMDEWQRNADVAFARRDEQFLGVKEDLARIMGTLSRIVWLIITAIVVAVMAFLIKGGFQVP